MREKALSQSEWQKFSKGRDLQDAALLKGLAALEKADKNPAARLGALDEIARQAEQLRKSARNDRRVVDFLDDLEKAVERQRHEARQDAKAADAEADEEDETPALLTSRMQPLLRDIRKGGVMPALIATNGKTAVVLLSRRAIGPSRRKLLSEALGQTGGVKYIPGECLFEQKAHTFVVATGASGLARKLRAALLEQTGLRLKVRVRGDDPTQVDADGEDEESDEPGAQAPAVVSPSAGLLAQLQSRLQALGPRIQQALAAAVPAEQAVIASLVGQLRQGLQQADAAKSQALLKSLALRLVDAGVSAEAPVSLVQLQGARLNWATTRTLLRQRLRMLEIKTLEFFAELPELARARTAVRRMDEIMEALDEDLIDTLDEALNESDPARRREIQAEARLCVEDYAEFVRSSALVADLDANPFTKVDIRETVLRSAEQLQSALG